MATQSTATVQKPAGKKARARVAVQERVPEYVVSCPCGHKYVSDVKLGMCSKCFRRYCAHCSDYTRTVE